MIVVSSAGRSMIEMLGVLAIIGVLSVGGIAGYSKAMATLRLNRWRKDIVLLIANIQMMYITQRTYSGRWTGNSGQGDKDITASFKNLEVIPGNMLDENGVDAFGNSLKFYERYWNIYGTRLKIQFESEKGQNAVKSCKTLFDFVNLYPTLWEVSIDGRYKVCGHGAPADYSKNSGCKPLPLNWAEMSAQCKKCEGVKCRIFLLFDNNV